MVNVDVCKVSVLLVYNKVRVEKVDFWLNYVMASCKSGLQNAFWGFLG